MVKTLHFHCRGHGFDPWSGNQDPPHALLHGKKKKKPTHQIKKKINALYAPYKERRQGEIELWYRSNIALATPRTLSRMAFQLSP